MIKGINHQVVELCDTGNEYFEKAILFVKPEYSGLGEGKLRERAQSVLKEAGHPPKCGVPEQKKRLGWLKLTLAGIAGAIISAGICLILTRI